MKNARFYVECRRQYDYYFFTFSTLVFYFIKCYSFLRLSPGDSTATRLLPDEFLYACIGLYNLSPSISTTAATAGFTSSLLLMFSLLFILICYIFTFQRKTALLRWKGAAPENEWFKQIATVRNCTVENQSRVLIEELPSKNMDVNLDDVIKKQQFVD